MRLTASLISDVETVGKVPKQILGRDAEKNDLTDCATINDLMFGKGQVTPENIVLTRQKDFSYRLVIGGDEFIQRLMSEAEEREKEKLRLSHRVSDLPTLAKRIMRGEGIEEWELRSGIRKREVVRARRIFCQLAIRKMGYSGAEVARFLGVTTSSVNRLAVSEEVPNLKKYLKLF